MNIIVLQHIKIEDPGFIKDLMLADAVEKITDIEIKDLIKNMIGITEWVYQT